MTLRRVICIWILCNFFIASVAVPSSFAHNPLEPTGLPFDLPQPGVRVDLSPVFQPALIKGLKVHPDNPFLFDFIVDPGDQKLSPRALKQVSQRMINYFLAALATPEKDLWVNLSPVEKNHIIPDTLIKTELGRDLLAEDYMLKQISASLIYPESGLGREFWDEVYTKAYSKYGVTQIPVNTFNKIWILPQKASVYERGNGVYIVNAHLKVMLEDDLLAGKLLGQKQPHSRLPVKDISKQVLREIVLPAVEREVNEDKNFACLRQVFYALILAQWYEETFKQSILNKDYSNHNKVAGIDVSNPQNKERIYQEYLAAYRKGVFNYIKEETDRVSQQPVPRKYFSGGFVRQHVDLDRASLAEIDQAMQTSRPQDFEVSFNPVVEESLANWYDLSRPWGLHAELEGLLQAGNRVGIRNFIRKYSEYIEAQKLYPVESAWPVLKAITLLTRSEENLLLSILQQQYPDNQRPELVDKIFLMNKIYDKQNWLEQRRPNLPGRMIYYLAAEIHYWTGGLGPVMEFHGKGMKDLGADVSYIEPDYQYDVNGNPLDYTDVNQGLTILNRNFMEFRIKIGNQKDDGYKDVLVRVTKAIDRNGVTTYLIRDVQPDGSAYYTKMLYNYSATKNPVSKEESTTFLNVSSAELIKRLETLRKEEQGEAWKSAIVHGNDGQFGPLQAVTMSRFGSEEVIKDILWAYSTHTDLNRANNWESKDEEIKKSPENAIRIVLKHMMGIKDRYINAFRQGNHIDYTSGGGRLAGFFGSVANSHADRMRYKDPHSVLTAITNGAVPEVMAGKFREIFENLKKAEGASDDIKTLKRQAEYVDYVLFKTLIEQGVFSADADFERPTPEQERVVKILAKQMLNNARIETANGGHVQVDLDKLLAGNARRLVGEKFGRDRADHDDNVWMKVELGYNVLLGGNNQRTEASEGLATKLKELEQKIDEQKDLRPAKFPGKVFFVETITRTQKILILAALDVEIQDSDDNEANGAFEEDGAANGVIIATGRWKRQGGSFATGTGVLAMQGAELDFDRPGRGNIVMPKQNTQVSWLEDVYYPLVEIWNGTVVKSRLERGFEGTVLDPANADTVWEPAGVYGATQVALKKDKMKELKEAMEKLTDEQRARIGTVLERHVDRNIDPQISFYENGVLGPRLNRVSYYLLTSSGYLQQYNMALQRQIDDAKANKEAIKSIVNAFGNDREAMEGFLYHGRNGTTSFTFRIDGRPEEFATGSGVIKYLKTEDRLEDEFGYNALLQYFIHGQAQAYFMKLAAHTPAEEPLERLLTRLRDEEGVSFDAKQSRLRNIIKDLITAMEDRLKEMGPADKAMVRSPGGIKLDNIPLERRGHLTAGIFNDRAFEEKLLNARGLRGVIMSVKPIINLPAFIN